MKKYRTRKELFSLKYLNEEITKNDITSVVSKVQKIDKRNYYKEYDIYIYDLNNNYLGSYNIQKKGL